MNTELDVDGAVLILNGATSVGAGSSGSMPAGGIVIVEAYGTTSSGTGSAIIQIQVSNNGTTWQTAGTINLNLKIPEHPTRSRWTIHGLAGLIFVQTWRRFPDWRVCLCL